MSTTGTVLVVVGVVAGAYVLMKIVSPAKPVRVAAQQPSGYSALAGIISSIVSVGAASRNNAYSAGSSGTSSSTDPNTPTVPAGFDVNNYTTSNGFEYTDANGHFIAG